MQVHNNIILCCFWLNSMINSVHQCANKASFKIMPKCQAQNVKYYTPEKLDQHHGVGSWNRPDDQE